MKKYISLAIIMVITLFVAACERLSDKIEIKIGMWPESSLTQDVAMYNEWKEAFEEDYPQYKVIGETMTYSPDTFFSDAQKQKIPTVFQTWFTEPSRIVKAGHAKDITAIMKKVGWYDKLDDKLAEYLTFDEKLYGIPRDGYGLGLVLNLDLFEQAGIIEYDDVANEYVLFDEDGNPLYPTTMAELRATAKKISDTLGDSVNGLIILNSNKNGGWQFSNIAWNFGAQLQVQDQDGTWKANLNSKEVIEAMEFIRDMYHEDESLKAGANIVYNDWHVSIANGTAAMAIAGNDVLSSVTTSGMSKDKIAFVPMPAGPNGDQYTLFGGTPFMFSAYASDEEVEGAIRFLEYMGRSPETSTVAQESMISGMKVASQKGMLILPTIKPWKNQNYLTMATQLENQWINVNMNYFNDFFNNINATRKPEEPHYTQEMYSLLDNLLQEIMSKNGFNVPISSRLNSINDSFQRDYLDKV